MGQRNSAQFLIEAVDNLRHWDMVRAHRRSTHTMPRSAQTSIEAIIRQAADQVVARVSSAIAHQVGALVQAELARELPRASGRGRGRGPARPAATRRRRRPPRGEITRWVPDSRARRVPTFVIEATGLDTKKKIVARFGTNVAFEKGKALPKPKAA
jgi:hypothetical protein